MRRILTALIGVFISSFVVFAQAPPVPAPPPSPSPAPAESELFAPSLALFKEKEGKYTLVALTYTPNSCYRAILTKDGFPGKEKTSDAEGIQLIIKSEPGKLCVQMKWPVVHHYSGLKPGKGKETVWVFAMLDGKIQGKNKVSLSSARDIASLTGGEIPTPFNNPN